MSLSLPYFKMDVIDWLKSEKIEAMSSAAIGGYIMLLCEAWTRPFCSLPSARLALMKLARWTGTDEEFTQVLQCFEPCKQDRTRLINSRLKREWDDTNTRITALSEAGKRGAQIKQALKEHHPAKVRTPRTKPVRKDVDEEFEQFWEAYPRKEGKIPARQAWDNATEKPSLVDLLQIIERLSRTESWTKDNGKYIPHPSTWLNKSRWTDRPPSNGHSNRPPPPPPKNDPIGRGQWGKIYGKPEDHGYA